MACLVSDPNGTRRIQFFAPTGERKTVRLGKLAKKDAESITRQIEALLNAMTKGQPLRQETAVWLSGIGAKLKAKLVTTGLIEAEVKKDGAKLGEVVDAYLKRRTDITPLHFDRFA